VHHPLVAERHGETPIFGTHAETPVERFEFEIDIGTRQGIDRLPDGVAGPNLEPRASERQGEGGAHVSPGGARHVLVRRHLFDQQIECTGFVAGRPVPHDVLGARPPALAEPPERQPQRVGERVDRRELEAGPVTQQHQLPRTVAPAEGAPPAERGDTRRRDPEPELHGLGIGASSACLEAGRSSSVG
jgi:hypothetical protein